MPLLFILIMAASIHFILLATIIVALSATSLVTANQNDGHKRIRRQEMSQLAFAQHGKNPCPNPKTACRDLGFSTGCCVITSSQKSCYRKPCKCYCDISCHLYGDCCDDIDVIGCSKPSDDAESCPSLTLGNGTIQYSPIPNSQEVGNIAYLSCNAGYSLVPSTSSKISVCQSNQQWSNPEPTCAKTCKRLSDPNGRITYEPATNTPVTRTVATYTCNEGYELFGSSIRVCEKRGRWSGIPHTRCLAVSCQMEYASSGGCAASLMDELLYDVTNATAMPVERCSCHPSCFKSRNVLCCKDIGCIPQNCTEAGVSPGCCDWNTTHRYNGACFIRNKTKNCYCDPTCNLEAFDDCCQDVPDKPSCSTPGPEAQSRNHAQSVRVKLMSQAQSSRPPMVNQASRDLASELKSMTRAQAEKRQRWEVIAKELEKMQNKKTY